MRKIPAFGLIQSQEVITGRCEKLYADNEAKRLAYIDGLLNLNELFLEMFGVTVHRAHFKDDCGILHRIKITNHLGMYQDSVLVTDWDSGLVDFRYFPNDCIKPYHWSDGLKAVRIKNSSRDDVIFLGSHRKIVCKSGAITVIESEEYEGEGLFCPDAVNGKSVFSSKRKI